MTDLYKRIAELAEKYRPLAVEMLKEVIRIPADYVAENPKCGLSNGEKERLTYLKNKIVEIGAVRDAKDVDFDGFGNLVWTVEDVNDGIPASEKKIIYLDGHSDTVGALRDQWLSKIGGGIDGQGRQDNSQSSQNGGGQNSQNGGQGAFGAQGVSFPQGGFPQGGFPQGGFPQGGFPQGGWPGN